MTTHDTKVVVTCSECGGQLRTDDPHWRHKPGCSQTQLWKNVAIATGEMARTDDKQVARLAEALSVNLYRVVPGEQMAMALATTLEQEKLTVVASAPEQPDACWISGYSDAPECRILPAGEQP